VILAHHTNKEGGDKQLPAHSRNDEHTSSCVQPVATSRQAPAVMYSHSSATCIEGTKSNHTHHRRELHNRAMMPRALRNGLNRNPQEYNPGPHCTSGRSLHSSCSTAATSAHWQHSRQHRGNTCPAPAARQQFQDKKPAQHDSCVALRHQSTPCRRHPTEPHLTIIQVSSAAAYCKHYYVLPHCQRCLINDADTGSTAKPKHTV
jgi:hypothetical protein